MEHKSAPGVGKHPGAGNRPAKEARHMTQGTIRRIQAAIGRNLLFTILMTTWITVTVLAVTGIIH
jgi:hypothetical protein